MLSAIRLPRRRHWGRPPHSRFTPLSLSRGSRARSVRRRRSLEVRKLPDVAKCPALGEVVKTCRLHLCKEKCDTVWVGNLV